MHCFDRKTTFPLQNRVPSCLQACSRDRLNRLRVCVRLCVDLSVCVRVCLYENNRVDRWHAAGRWRMHGVNLRVGMSVLLWVLEVFGSVAVLDLLVRVIFFLSLVRPWKTGENFEPRATTTNNRLGSLPSVSSGCCCCCWMHRGWDSRMYVCVSVHPIGAFHVCACRSVR